MNTAAPGVVCVHMRRTVVALLLSPLAVGVLGWFTAQGQGVLARGFREPGWDRHLRITVGLPQENDRALAALAAALAASPKELVA